jgi:heme o synthase
MLNVLGRRLPQRRPSFDLKSAAAIASHETGVIDRGWTAVFMELIKARLTFLVILTTLVGFYLGSPEGLDLVLLAGALIGTSALAAGAACLNQLLECEWDARMKRTRTRPLPAGEVAPTTVLLLGAVMCLGGLAVLSFGVNLLTALLGSLTLASYLFIYTPLKRTTVLNTVVGAIPGALPPLMGWTAATGSLAAPGWALFAILFFWQLPHFMAIAWLYREDYAQAGFRMLSGSDPTGSRTAGSAIRNTLALVAVSLVPFLQQIAGRIYLVVALVLGGVFIVTALRFGFRRTPQSARQLFFASILYLPLLLTVLVIDRAKREPSTASFLSAGPTISVPLGLPDVFTCPRFLPGHRS